MSSFCVGLKISMEEGMILHFISKGTQKLPMFLRKPLIDCVYCFSSFYGGLVFWTVQLTLGNINPYTFTYWVILTICCVYINGALYNGLKQEFKASK